MGFVLVRSEALPEAPTAEHWMWVTASGPPGRRIVLFDDDPSRAGTVPKRLLQAYQGILLTDGYEPYAIVAAELKLVQAGCMAHARHTVIGLYRTARRRPTNPVAHRGKGPP
jgi:transposase